MNPKRIFVQPESSAAIWLGVLIFGAAFVYLCFEPINHDTGWFMYAARGMIEGGTLYKDYIDINAPAAYYTMLPAAWFSTWPFVSNQAALAACGLAYTLIAYILCVLITGHMKLPPRVRAGLWAGLLIVLCFFPHYTFGQREHLLVVFMMPYVFSASARFHSPAPPRWLMIACGVCAAVALSIKIPYVLVPAFIEAAVLIRRKWKLAFTPDLLALIVATVVLYLFYFALYPGYWTSLFPTLLSLYDPYNNDQYILQLSFLIAPVVALSVLTGDYVGRAPLAQLRWMMTAAMFGGFGVFLIQFKGWPHHAAVILLFAGALLVVNLLPAKPIKNILATMLRSGIILAVFGYTYYLQTTSYNVNPDMTRDVDSLVRHTDGSFYIMSTGNYPGFPLALTRGYKWTSRYPELIALPGLLKAKYEGHPSPFEPTFRAQILEDLQRGRPATLLVYKYDDVALPPNFDILGWFTADPAFRTELNKHYRYMGDMLPFAVFARKS